MLVTMAIGNGAPVTVAAATGPATVVLLGAVFVVMGFGIALANVHKSSLRQSVVPDRLQGRVNACYRLVSWGALGAHTGMLIGAFGIATATLWVALSPIPGLHRAPTAQPA